MATLLALISLSIVSAVFAFLYIKGRKRNQAFEKKIAVFQSTLENVKEGEYHLRQKLSALQNKLSHAMEDPLTNLLGWPLFEDRLNQSIYESARYRLIVGILIIDIDDFKVINNALNHQIGDELLRVVAKRIQTSIRQVDSASRFTKDTFYVLLTQLGKPETAAIVAQRVLQALEQPILINEHELYITACIGISIFPADGQDAATLLRSADYALHIAKEKGKQIYQFYHERIHANSQRELALATGLRRESVMNEFAIYYQPIINVQDNSIVCMDALLHWQHPSLGWVSPQELLGYAEKQGKLNVISEWLLRSACKHFLSWRKFDFNPMLLGIPLFLKQLENSQFIYHISHILQELQFNPAWLLFEIKDDEALSLDILEKAFNMLTYLNVKLAIANFGSAPFSLRDLKHFTVNYLKLDPFFIDHIEDDHKAIELINSILFLANSLSIELVVQGVETQQQLDILKKLNCTLMQGSQLSAPILERDVLKKMTIKETK